jgi:hypothetical protein
MPKQTMQQPTEEYLISRTMYRPRDLIVFFNYCIEQALDKPEITAQMILNAEGEYSLKRLRSLYDEWFAELPELEQCIDILKRRPAHFHLNDMPIHLVEDLALKLAVKEETARSNKRISAKACLAVDKLMPMADFLAYLISVFYRTGLVGIKIEISTSPRWSFRHEPQIEPGTIRADAVVHICPVFWRALGVNPKVVN